MSNSMMPTNYDVKFYDSSVVEKKLHYHYYQQNFDRESLKLDFWLKWTSLELSSSWYDSIYVFHHYEDMHNLSTD